MGSSSSKADRRSKRVANSVRQHSTRGSSSRHKSSASSSGRRIKPEQRQSTRLAFAETVTFNPIFCHKECLLRQLNWWILDGNIGKGGTFRLNKGGPAGPSGECGSVGRWDYCSLSQQYQSPPAYRDIGSAAIELDLQAALSQAIQTAVTIAYEQPFEDANARTAILYMVERLAYQGLAVRTDVDLFSIYAHLKSITATGNAPPPESVVGTHIINILGMATRKAPVHWEERMVLANRIKADLHDEVLEIQLYYKDLQKLNHDKLREQLERDKEQNYVLYSRFRLLFPRPALLSL
ncbi:hypothetical protein RhiJN_02815 [Ceratobasidium sp. AG-Ba]|nr:hypothetical protein RhiJN_02815 [Ceratobasidium sp. AG-Ba]